MNDQSSDFRPITRERIVEAARQLFFRQGYTATGISQILKAAEAKSGSLYHFFPSKEDLLAAVLEVLLLTAASREARAVMLLAELDEGLEENAAERVTARTPGGGLAIALLGAMLCFALLAALMIATG